MKQFLYLVALAAITATAAAEPPPVGSDASALPPVQLAPEAKPNAAAIPPLPAVPPSVVRDSIDAASKATAGLSRNEELAEPEGPTTITIRPGITELLRVAKGYLNEFVTPFDDPIVITAQEDVTWKKIGRTVLLGSGDERPLGVHIRSSDESDPRDISLALIPAKIPPKSVTLKWPGVALVSTGSNARAKRWEESEPYQDTLTQLASTLARGELPDGYALEEAGEELPCSLPEVHYHTGQKLVGYHFTTYVLKVTNVGGSVVELQAHAGCNFPEVAMVAPWPYAQLQPGMSTELYVAVSNDETKPQTSVQRRPSLLAE